MNLAAEKQPLVSEIIADQQKEIESLKVELQKMKIQTKSTEIKKIYLLDSRITLQNYNIC